MKYLIIKGSSFEAPLFLRSRPFDDAAAKVLVLS
jgi:hypothetical protein